MDQLLGTTYFHERHLQSLVERLKHRGRVNSIQHMADQIFRLFSSNDTNCETAESQPKDGANADLDKENGVMESSKVEIDILIDSPVGDAPMLTAVSNNCIEDMSVRKPLLSPVSPTSGNGSEPRNLCQQLCAILKSRLLKAHEDAEMRFGMPRSETSALLAAEIEQLQNGILPDGQIEPSNPVANNETKEPDCEEQSLPSAEEEVVELNSVGQGIVAFCDACLVFDSYVVISILKIFGLRWPYKFRKSSGQKTCKISLRFKNTLYRLPLHCSKLQGFSVFVWPPLPIKTSKVFFYRINT